MSEKEREQVSWHAERCFRYTLQCEWVFSFKNAFLGGLTFQGSAAGSQRSKAANMSCKLCCSDEFLSTNITDITLNTNIMIKV